MLNGNNIRLGLLLPIAQPAFGDNDLHQQWFVASARHAAITGQAVPFDKLSIAVPDTHKQFSPSNVSHINHQIPGGKRTVNAVAPNAESDGIPHQRGVEFRRVWADIGFRASLDGWWAGTPVYRFDRHERQPGDGINTYAIPNIADPNCADPNGAGGGVNTDAGTTGTGNESDSDASNADARGTRANTWPPLCFDADANAARDAAWADDVATWRPTGECHHGFPTAASYSHPQWGDDGQHPRLR